MALLSRPERGEPAAALRNVQALLTITTASAAMAKRTTVAILPYCRTGASGTCSSSSRCTGVNCDDHRFSALLATTAALTTAATRTRVTRWVAPVAPFPLRQCVRHGGSFCLAAMRSAQWLQRRQMQSVLARTACRPLRQGNPSRRRRRRSSRPTVGAYNSLSSALNGGGQTQGPLPVPASGGRQSPQGPPRN